MTCRSLCIIDEFGKGTLCADGVGLLCAALRHFAAQQPSCKLIACTHFSEVLDEHYLARRVFAPETSETCLMIRKMRLDNLHSPAGTCSWPYTSTCRACLCCCVAQNRQTHRACTRGALIGLHVTVKQVPAGTRSWPSTPWRC